LNDGPTKKASIGDAYQGKELPHNIANMVDARITCPKTGKWITQKDNNQMFLVPVS
jgi:hypothetical protein